MNSKCFDTQLIKAEALRLGFSACGVARAEAVRPEVSLAFNRWLAGKKEANMNYMSNHLEKRLDPTLLMEGTKSIISVALNYYPKQQIADSQFQFAWYAYGKDYHDIMKAKLNELQAYIATIYLYPIQSRVFCDTAPVLERYWAQQAGLGWIGKNTQLIIPHAGSTFFLGEIFIDAEADKYDTPLPNRCGSCSRCIDNCPTNALDTNLGLNSARCLSYLTIEHRENIPSLEAKKMGNKVYGCDECQRACPWMRFATPCNTPELQPTEAFLEMSREDWNTLTEEHYRALFKGSAVKRAKYNGLMRNIKTNLENQSSE